MFLGFTKTKISNNNYELLSHNNLSIFGGKIYPRLFLKNRTPKLKSCVMFSFPYVNSDLGVLILFGKIRLETGWRIWKTHFALRLLGWEFHEKPASFFNIFSGDLHVDALISRLCLGLPYWSDSWRRYNLKGFCW